MFESADYHKRLEQIKQTSPNAYEPWTEDNDFNLKLLYFGKVEIEVIAQILKRQPSAIRSRLKHNGLI